MVKFSADMVGNQIEAEQIKDSSGAHLVNTHTTVAFEKNI
ncbi:MAG: hypothetical protein KatS3mg104_3230 [Phycisphaerae bacterium]|nr:MAG: hypothetical protein KatS3mg104_3230 [Phycisphaerae bacterium]